MVIHMSDNSIDKKKQEIISYVRKYIRKNKLKENDKILSENQLAEKFGVNRNTVRGALAILKAQGFIYSQKGRGFFVAQRPKPIVFEHDNSLGFSEILNKGKRSYTSSVIDYQLALPNAVEQKMLRIKADDMVYRVRQLRSYKDSPFAVCLSVLPQKKVPDFDKHLDNFSGINNILLNTYSFTHPICKKVEITASLPNNEEIKLLGITENIPILQQKNLFYIEEIGNIEYFIVRARGDAFRFSMDLK